MSAGLLLGIFASLVGGVLATAGAVGVNKDWDPPVVPGTLAVLGIFLFFLGFAVMHQASEEGAQARLGDRAEIVAEIREDLKSLDERIEQLLSDVEAYDGKDRK